MINYPPNTIFGPYGGGTVSNPNMIDIKHQLKVKRQMQSRSEIPTELRDAAKDIAKICEKYGLRSCEATLRPNIRSEFRDFVTFTWNHMPHASTPTHVVLKYNTAKEVRIHDEGV